MNFTQILKKGIAYSFSQSLSKGNEKGSKITLFKIEEDNKKDVNNRAF